MTHDRCDARAAVTFSAAERHRPCFVSQDDETEEILSNDFEIGQCLRDQVIPKAVLYFTGEALDYSDVSFSWFSVTACVPPV